MDNQLDSEFNYPSIDQDDSSGPYAESVKTKKKHHRWWLIIVIPVAAFLFLLGLATIIVIFNMNQPTGFSAAGSNGYNVYQNYYGDTDTDGVYGYDHDTKLTFDEMCKDFDLDPSVCSQAFIDKANMVGSMYVPYTYSSSNSNVLSTVAYTVYGTSQVLTNDYGDNLGTAYNNICIMFNDGYVLSFKPEYYVQVLNNQDIASGDISLQTKANIIYEGEPNRPEQPTDDAFITLEYPDKGYGTVSVDGWGLKGSYSDANNAYEYLTTAQLNSMIASKGQQ
jgi:hypothetical protein